jgi:hypothetical protein
MTLHRALVATALSIMAVVIPIRPATASATVAVPGICRLETAAIQSVLGVTSPEKFAGPDVLKGTTCSWRTTDPNCFVRSLSIRSHRNASERAAVKKLRATTASIDLAPSVLGPNAFFSRTDLGAAAAINIERLFVPRGRDWIEITLAGRLGADGSHDLLFTAAKAIPRFSAR